MSLDLNLPLFSFIVLSLTIDFIGAEGNYVNGSGDERLKSLSHSNRAVKLSGLYSKRKGT
ncbi:MAG: hypothetical protein FJ217_06840 [Ignavibacteria bacterium]|nr:hypothetical protein [Ignavibacteria bacterium]